MHTNLSANNHPEIAQLGHTYAWFFVDEDFWSAVWAAPDVYRPEFTVGLTSPIISHMLRSIVSAIPTDSRTCGEASTRPLTGSVGKKTYEAAEFSNNLKQQPLQVRRTYLRDGVPCYTAECRPAFCVNLVRKCRYSNTASACLGPLPLSCAADVCTVHCAAGEAIVHWRCMHQWVHCSPWVPLPLPSFVASYPG